MPEKIAILGWGSLLWDSRPEFDQRHGAWRLDGPMLKIEFSRISASRAGALTLVLDAQHGADTRVAYCLSLRTSLPLAIEDLRTREGTTLSNIAHVRASGTGQSRDSVTQSAIAAWATVQKFDAVVWTDLQSNFRAKTKTQFSVDAATAYLRSLSVEGRRAAFDYIDKAPYFVDTPLRQARKRMTGLKEA
jgi:cation transport regulator ChaC